MKSSLAQKTELASILKRNENIRWREFGTDAILLNPSSGDYFEISEAGFEIWKRIDGCQTLEAIINELARHFDADNEDLIKDASEFIAELISKDLISIVS